MNKRRRWKAKRRRRQIAWVGTWPSIIIASNTYWTGQPVCYILSFDKDWQQQHQAVMAPSPLYILLAQKQP